MASSRRKQDEKHLKILRELVSKPANRTCFDCHQKGPTYINMTIGSFVCTSCSGILRGLNPPHRVKSISMASFTSEEVDQIKLKGNQYCQAVWLGLYDGKSNVFPDTKDEHKIRDFMINKYEKKRFYVEPSIAMKNGVGGGGGGGTSQPKSESSSSASTPGSDSRSLGGSLNSISRPSSNVQNTRGSTPTLNGSSSQQHQQQQPQQQAQSSSSSALKLSSSVDLLNGLGKVPNGGSGINRGTKEATTSNDPFGAAPAPVNGSANPVPPSSTEGFANFDNANIFSSASISKPTPNPYPPFSSNPLTPLSSSSNTSSSKPVSSSATSNTTTFGGSAPNVNALSVSEDRYAALKDLDEAFKSQSQVENPTGANQVIFGSPPSSGNSQPQNGGNMFGTSPVTAGNGFFPNPAALPTQGWNATFQTPNPFSGNGAQQPPNMSSPWSNGAKFGNSGTAPVQSQANPFAGGADPNFNSQFVPAFGMTPNHTNNNNSATANGGWSSFGNGSSGAPINVQNGSNKHSTNPWGASSPPNPFNVPAPVVPSNGSSYNPFL